ncbi:uncharacterized protein LY89DRAFT_678628 [Mollisia scopiformis]|uniref:Uncharacterized protein n=1 Tax=Mollisia scopiformis TaxID=149040 RepID=A0A132B2D4_MOLSC|nr:uncharacterized protein LY89DRAFT_678628 [Mollisia scopiformis]KUJ06542.1 hypothetical protein LY89DRAFT_678628 [Mollisia scopiformis]
MQSNAPRPSASTARRNRRLRRAGQMGLGAGHANTLANHRANSPRPQFTPTDIASVRIEHTAVGNVCWLTDQSKVPEDVRCVHNHHCIEPYMRADGYRHPVLITGLYQREGSSALGDIMARFQSVSAYNGEDLGSYIYAKTYVRKFLNVIPIRQGRERPEDGVFREPIPPGRSPSNSKPIPWSSVDKKGEPATATFQLELSPESQLLAKQSYVDIEHVWEVPLRYLKPYRFRGVWSKSYSFRISKDSYHVIAARTGQLVQPYTPIDVVKARTFVSTLEEWYGFRPPVRALWLQKPALGRGLDSGHALDVKRLQITAGKHTTRFSEKMKNVNKAGHGEVHTTEAGGVTGSERHSAIPFESNIRSLQTDRKLQSSTATTPRSSGILNPRAATFSPRSMSTLKQTSPISPLTIPPPAFFPTHEPNSRAPETWEMPLPNHQTAYVLQEPIIPMSPFFNSLGIGRDREFIYKPGEPPIRIRFPKEIKLEIMSSKLDMMLVDEDEEFLEDAQCPRDFLADW